MMPGMSSRSPFDDLARRGGVLSLDEAPADTHLPDVTTILVMSDVLPLAEVKAKFSEMVDRVEQQHDRITVTRNGRPAAVLISADDLAALEDTLDLLSDPVAMADIAQARRDVVAGKTFSADEIRAKYLRQ